MNATIGAPNARWQMPRVNEDDRWLTGTASGIAVELGVQPLVIRASFMLLLLAGGAGGALYILAWAVLSGSAERLPDHYEPQPKGATVTHRNLGVGIVVLGMLLLLDFGNIGFVGNVVWPAGFVFVGALIAWSHGRNLNEGISSAARVMAGLAVGIGGAIAFATANLSPGQGLFALVFSLALLGGIGVILAPSLMRIGSALDTERQERIRADERAEVATHLHDSVLQTLSLIQRHAGDPVTTAQLARRQERELRNWLYTPQSPEGTMRVSAALQDMATKVEADHGVDVEVVVVGDVAMEAQADASLLALLGATKEAVTNAAKHSGSSRIDVFTEIRDGAAEVFIRDTGAGFDPEDIDGDRRGIVDSIRGRMDRHGGTAAIHSVPGEGTEVELTIQLTAPDAATETEPSQEGQI